MKKRILAMILSVAMVASMGDIAVFAAEEGTQIPVSEEAVNVSAEVPVSEEVVNVSAEESDYSYEELEDGTISITGYNGKSTELIIPDSIGGKMVSSIGGLHFLDVAV